MAVIKAINSHASLARVINYITKDGKTDKSLIGGYNCRGTHALFEMKATKKMWRKNGGTGLRHTDILCAADTVSCGIHRRFVAFVIHTCLYVQGILEKHTQRHCRFCRRYNDYCGRYSACDGVQSQHDTYIFYFYGNHDRLV